MVEEVKPLVSIIMPVHDCIDYIMESLGSLCKQSYTNLEIIIVDTSTDDKASNTNKDTKAVLSGKDDIYTHTSIKDKLSDIVRQLNDERIRIIRLEPSAGLKQAFAEGLANSKGEFVTRHDPDDISSPIRFEMQVKHLQDNPELGMVSCLIRCITDESSYRNACTFIERIHNQYTDFAGISHAILNNFVPIIFPTLLFRRELLNTVNALNETQFFDDQLEFLLHLMKNSDVEKINMQLYTYRRHQQAYHIVKDPEYQNYCINVIRTSDITNYLRFNSFYKQIKMHGISKVSIGIENNLRVLILIDALNIGGTETHVLNLARKLLESGAYVVIGTSGGPMSNIFALYGIKIYNIPFNSDNVSNKDIFALLKQVKSILDEEKINLIHAHLFASMRIGSEMSKIYNVPYITTIHGLFYPKDILFRTCFNAAKVIAVSEPVKNMLCTYLGTRMNDLVSVLPNGVYMDASDMRAENPEVHEKYNIPDDQLVITYCSRLAWGKTNAAESFLFSIFNLWQSCKNIHAFIIGDGEGKQLVKREADMINSILGEEKIHLIGAVFNVEDYYAESDIVVGTGRVALEAMSLGKPVVAIGNQGYMGIIDPDSCETQWSLYFGDHGHLGDINVNKITEDLKYLVEHPDKRKELGQWSRDWCGDMFNIEKIAQNTMDIYREALAVDSTFKTL